jgi:hypothetical protein
MTNQICPCETETITPRSPITPQSLQAPIDPRSYQFKPTPTDPLISETARREDHVENREGKEVGFTATKRSWEVRGYR